MITAKVKCYSKTFQIPGSERVCIVKFIADYQDGRNKEWAAYTPSLQLEMTLKAEVADRFELEGHYTLTFSED